MPETMTTHVTRLAPSPTGALHLGNARTFLVNHLLARREHWRVRMRIEDLDSPRIKPGATEDMLDTLAWLGLTWDRTNVVVQSTRADQYEQALACLADKGAAYPCVCTRKDIETAASAPHAEDNDGAYPGTCRGRFPSADAARAATGRDVAWRVIVPDAPIAFADAFAGAQSFDLRNCGGDFVIFKKSGSAAYQLAVVVDDAAAGVNAIVRGQDLLDSAARQIHLRRLLGLGPEPRYWHLPLVVGPDGRRLAKRHGDTRLDTYRAAGATPQKVLGLLGYWCGWIDTRRDSSMDELAERFTLDTISADPVVFSPADDAFLRGE